MDMQGAQVFVGKRVRVTSSNFRGEEIQVLDILPPRGGIFTEVFQMLGDDGREIGYWEDDTWVEVIG